METWAQQEIESDERTGFLDLPSEQRYLTYYHAEQETGIGWWGMTVEQREAFKVQAVREHTEQEEVNDQ